MNDLRKKLKQKNFSSMYVLLGTEMYFINEALQLLLTEALAEEDREFNTVTYDLEEAYIEEVIEDAHTLPFFGERKIIIVKSPYFLTAQKEKLEQNIKALEAYIQEPSPFSILVFIAPFEKLDERKKITKQLKQKAEVVAANVLQGQELKAWLTSRMEAEGAKLLPEAADMLLELAGSNMLLLSQEIQKLILYVGTSGTVTRDIVLQLVPKSAEQSVFALVERVVKKDIAGVMRMLEDLLVQQEEPIKILALVASQFRLLYQVKELQHHGYAQNQIASHLGVHPYRVKLAMNQTQRFSVQELRSILDHLADADYDMKTGKLDKRLILEMFFMRLNSIR